MSNTTSFSPTCFDGQLSGNDTDVDCGDPACGILCDAGQLCSSSDNCRGGLACAFGVCGHRNVSDSPPPLIASVTMLFPGLAVGMTATMEFGSRVLSLAKEAVPQAGGSVADQTIHIARVEAALDTPSRRLGLQPVFLQSHDGLAVLTRSRQASSSSFQARLVSSDEATFNIFGTRVTFAIPLAVTGQSWSEAVQVGYSMLSVLANASTEATLLLELHQGIDGFPAFFVAADEDSGMVVDTSGLENTNLFALINEGTVVPQVSPSPPSGRAGGPGSDSNRLLGVYLGVPLAVLVLCLAGVFAVWRWKREERRRPRRDVGERIYPVRPRALSRADRVQRQGRPESSTTQPEQANSGDPVTERARRVIDRVTTRKKTRWSIFQPPSGEQAPLPPSAPSAGISSGGQPGALGPHRPRSHAGSSRRTLAPGAAAAIARVMASAEGTGVAGGETKPPSIASILTSGKAMELPEEDEHESGAFRSRALSRAERTRFASAGKPPMPPLAEEGRSGSGRGGRLHVGPSQPVDATAYAKWIASQHEQPREGGLASRGAAGGRTPQQQRSDAPEPTDPTSRSRARANSLVRAQAALSSSTRVRNPLLAHRSAQAGRRAAEQPSKSDSASSTVRVPAARRHLAPLAGASARQAARMQGAQPSTRTLVDNPLHNAGAARTLPSAGQSAGGGVPQARGRAVAHSTSRSSQSSDVENPFLQAMARQAGRGQQSTRRPSALLPRPSAPQRPAMPSQLAAAMSMPTAGSAGHDTHFESPMLAPSRARSSRGSNRKK